MEKTEKKDISGLIVSFFIIAMLSMAAAKLPVLAFVTLPVWALAIPAALAYLIICCPRAGGVAGVAAIGAAAIFSPAAAIGLAAAFVPVSVCAAVVIRQKKRFRDSAVMISGFAFLGILLLIGVIWLHTRLLPVDYIAARIGQRLSALGDAAVNMLYQIARFLDVQAGAITQEAVLMTPRAQATVTMLKILREWVNYFLAAGIAVYSLLSGLVCGLIPRSFAKRRGIPVANVPAFSDYELPRGLWAAFLVSYLAAAVGNALKLPSFDMLLDTVFCIYAFLFIIQALSFADFLYKARGLSPKVRVALQTLAVIIFGGLLMFLGILENMLGFRRRSQEKGDADF